MQSNSALNIGMKLIGLACLEPESDLARSRRNLDPAMRSYRKHGRLRTSRGFNFVYPRITLLLGHN